MQAIFALIERIARTSSTVLVHGESGTGKELIARAIHFAEPAGHPAVPVASTAARCPRTCSRASSSATSAAPSPARCGEKKGLFQEADGGTLFLDEIGEMTPTMQVKLLRALQEKVVRKVGGTEEETIDVRVIAATNQDLESAARRPASSARTSTTGSTCCRSTCRRCASAARTSRSWSTSSSQKYCRQMELPPRQISVEAMDVLESYDWPGNVRELENLIERVLALSHAETVTTRDLPVHLLTNRRTSSELIQLPEEGIDLEAYLEDIRAQLMLQALERTEGVQTQAAELLGMSFRSFRYYAKKAGLKGGE